MMGSPYSRLSVAVPCRTRQGPLSPAGLGAALRARGGPAQLSHAKRRSGGVPVQHLPRPRVLPAPPSRGVTCVAAGRQALSYTDIHPSLGDPALLEAMAQNGEGSVRVRRVNPAQ